MLIYGFRWYFLLVVLYLSTNILVAITDDLFVFPKEKKRKSLFRSNVGLK